jgi:hypothetical protein
MKPKKPPKLIRDLSGKDQQHLRSLAEKYSGKWGDLEKMTIHEFNEWLFFARSNLLHNRNIFLLEIDAGMRAN